MRINLLCACAKISIINLVRIKLIVSRVLNVVPTKFSTTKFSTGTRIHVHILNLEGLYGQFFYWVDHGFWPLPRPRILSWSSTLPPEWIMHLVEVRWSVVCGHFIRKFPSWSVVRVQFCPEIEHGLTTGCIDCIRCCIGAQLFSSIWIFNFEISIFQFFWPAWGGESCHAS